MWLPAGARLGVAAPDEGVVTRGRAAVGIPFPATRSRACEATGHSALRLRAHRRRPIGGGRPDTASSGEVSLAPRGARLEAVANEDVEAVRRFYAAWTAGDLEAMLAEVDPEVEAQPVLGLLYERPSYRGHSGISRWFEEVDDLWDDFESHVEATYDIGGAVIAIVRLVAHTRGRASDSRIAVVCRFRDGKILSFRGRDRDEVIEELHLPA